MYTVKNGGDIHKGDLVAVCHTNDFIIGIYFGQGRGGTFQYYNPYSVPTSESLIQSGGKRKKSFNTTKKYNIRLV